MTSKRWLVPVAGIGALAVLVVVAAVLALRPASSDPTPDRASPEGIEPALCRVADDDPDNCVEDLMPVPAADCPEEFPDCDDTVDIIDGGPYDGDPDRPVSSEPPITVDPVDEGCSLVHDVESCQNVAIELVMLDVTERTGARPDEITLIAAEYVDWPDSSLGNPQPDMAYLQVITPGFKIVVEHGGTQYTYHTDTGSRVELVQ